MVGAMALAQLGSHTIAQETRYTPNEAQDYHDDREEAAQGKEAAQGSHGQAGPWAGPYAGTGTPTSTGIPAGVLRVRVT